MYIKHINLPTELQGRVHKHNTPLMCVVCACVMLTLWSCVMLTLWSHDLWNIAFSFGREFCRIVLYIAVQPSSLYYVQYSLRVGQSFIHSYLFFSTVVL